MSAQSSMGKIRLDGLLGEVLPLVKGKKALRVKEGEA